MYSFSYKARDKVGNLVEGVIDAKDEDALATVLEDKDLYLTQAKEIAKAKAMTQAKERTPAKQTAPAKKIAPAKERKSKGRGVIKKPVKTTARSRAKVKRADLIVFTTHLAAVLSAGIPILKGLTDLEEQTESTKFKKVIAKVREDIYQGSDLADSLKEFPRIFTPSYVNTVRAGSASGKLDGILHELAAFLEWQEEISIEIKKTSTYPVVILIAISALVSVIFVFALPKISKMLLDMKIPLPLITRIMIGATDFIRDNMLILGLSAFALVAGISYARKTEKGIFIIDSIKLKLPVLGGLLRKIAISHFAHHLSLMWSAGVGISTSLTLIAGVVGNVRIAKVIKKAREDVIAGEMLSTSLKKSGEFPPLIISMINIGEATGKMDVGLNKVVEFYNREVPASVKKVFSVMEPLLFVFLAMIVLSIAMAIYLPLYTGLSAMGK